MLNVQGQLLFSRNRRPKEQQMKENSSRILLVEDDVDHAEILARVLQTSPYGYVLHVAGSIGEAYSAIACFKPHLIIADVLLSDGRGMDLASVSRAKDSKIPIILVSSQGGRIIEEEAKKAGVSRYIVKSERTIAEIPDIAARVLAMEE